jgi:transposase InsO family protein
VATIAQGLRKMQPELGKGRTAEMLARAGVHLSRTTVGRLRQRSVPKTPPEPTKPTQPEQPAKAAEASHPKPDAKPKAERKIISRHPHHTWHIDLSVLPVLALWLPWWPFSLPQYWPFCFWVCVIQDHFSRSVVGWRLFGKEPTAREVCTLLDDARRAVGRAPKYTVTDQGVQFREEFREWCEKHDVRPRFGAIGKSGSIAIVERFFLALKTEMLHRLAAVPFRLSAMQREITAYTFWYNQHRPHSSLGGRTPAEVRDGQVAACDRPALEPRARYPLARRQPARLARRVRGKLELVVEHVDGRAHLPIVSLRRAA